MSDTLTFSVPTVLMPSLSARSVSGRRRWRSVLVETLTEAEDLLDEAETDGHTERELVVQGGTFVVRWR